MHFGIQLHRVKLSMFAEMKEKKPSLCRFFSTKSIICGKNRQKFRLKSVTFI